MSSILVVDDEIGIRDLLSEILSEEGYTIYLAEDASAARAIRLKLRPDLVLLDIWMPDMDGVSLLKEWSANGQLTMPVIMMSGHATIDTAVEATKIGALDFLEKPIALQKLLVTIRRALQAPQTAARSTLSLAAFSRSAVFSNFYQRIRHVCQHTRKLLLYGVVGSIAEISARSLHRANTAWIDGLNALKNPPDRWMRTVTGGVVFISDLTKLDDVSKTNLLYFLQNFDSLNCMLVAASPVDEAALLESDFPKPLLNALGHVWLKVPELKEHVQELPEIASVFLEHMIENRECPLRYFSTAALNMLNNRQWSGSYDELKHTLKNLALISLEEEIQVDDVEKVLQAETPAIDRKIAAGLNLDKPLREAREIFEFLYFSYHIQRENGNMTKIAEKTGVERTHLYRKLKQLGLSVGKRSEQ